MTTVCTRSGHHLGFLHFLNSWFCKHGVEKVWLLREKSEQRLSKDEEQPVSSSEGSREPLSTWTIRPPTVQRAGFAAISTVHDLCFGMVLSVRGGGWPSKESTDTNETGHCLKEAQRSLGLGTHAVLFQDSVGATGAKGYEYLTFPKETVNLFILSFCI